jgi:hypothetical protein
MTTGREPQLGGQLAPQLGGSNYYLWVNHDGTGGSIMEVLPPGYATKAQAKLALIDWLHEHYPARWTLGPGGEQFLFIDTRRGGYIAGMILSAKEAERCKAEAIEHPESNLHVVGGVLP